MVEVLVNRCFVLGDGLLVITLVLGAICVEAVICQFLTSER